MRVQSMQWPSCQAGRGLEDGAHLPGTRSFGCCASLTPLCCRPRWKPNQEQISLLEQHFGSGNSKPTTELTASVQAAGEATEQQVRFRTGFGCDVVLWARPGCCRLPVTVSHTSNVPPLVQVGVWLKNRLARAKRDAKVRTTLVQCGTDRLHAPDLLQSPA